VRFFESLGLKLKIERGKRVFPESDKASDVTWALRSYMNQNGVKVIGARAERSY
jgi:predicted flavoprotein YhiN